MSDFIEHVAGTIAQRRLFKPKDSIVIAVSGGLDSMVLLDTLCRLAQRHRWRLVVAHFNHQLRQKESDGDERFVARVARRLDLEFVGERWPSAGQALAKEHGWEMAARLARHDFLARVAEKHRIHTIALAHHADDQAELFFLRLLRGAGGEGLSGMKWESPGLARSGGRASVRLVRPFLDLGKADLLAHAKKYHVRFREDSSNTSHRHARNRIRHQLLPLLEEKFESAIVKMVMRTMDLTGTDADFVRREAERWLATSQSMGFEQLHPAMQRQCLRLQISRLLVVPTYDLVEYLRLHPDEPMTTEANCALARDKTGRVRKVQELPATFTAQERTMELTRGRGVCQFGEATVRWRREALKEDFCRPTPRPGREYFDADKVGSTVTLRHWRPGDRFQPIGMACAVKLQDVFVNSKIPRPRRHELMVAATKTGEIWWVEGLRIGERFKVGRATEWVLAWNWLRHPGAGPGTPLQADR